MMNVIFDAARKFRRKKEYAENRALYARLYPADSLERKKFYNIGAGGFRHPYWTNVDIPSDHYDQLFANGRRDIPHDLLLKQPIPVADSDAELIYSSHTIEH